MWMPTHDEAVEIYADYLTARHGRSAHRYARKTADKLQRNGDLAGYTAWNLVADALERKARKSADVETIVASVV
jgi:hypothetical protein